MPPLVGAVTTLPPAGVREAPAGFCFDPYMNTAGAAAATAGRPFLLPQSRQDRVETPRSLQDGPGAVFKPRKGLAAG